MKKDVSEIRQLIQWLTSGDVAIRYQTERDLLESDNQELRGYIDATGWGKELLSRRNVNGHWGGGFYSPKWISSHYTLLDLKNLSVDPGNKLVRETIAMILSDEKGPDGGINPAGTIRSSDLCINGMALNYSCYFGADEKLLKTVVDFILTWQMPDGGFNCRSNRQGAVHSSLHTTLSVAEGLWEYRNNGYKYRLEEVISAERSAREFMLMHRLFRSDKTGEVIHPAFTVPVYPPRWKYDFLRALDYFRDSGAPYDDRMKDAIDLLHSKRNRDMTWNHYAKHPGKVHFEMEQAGKPGRWNTLRALRVLRRYDGLRCEPAG